MVSEVSIQAARGLTPRAARGSPRGRPRGYKIGYVCPRSAKVLPVLGGVPTLGLPQVEPLGPSPSLRCCVLQQPKAFALCSMLPSGTPRLPRRDGEGFR